MTALLDAATLLSSLLQTDITLALAQAAAWLDPGMLISDEDQDDTIAYTLSICRRCFPDVYATALHHLRNGASEIQLDHILCEGIGGYLVVDVQSTHELQFGIPWQAVGVDLYDMESVREHQPQLISVATWFGVKDDSSFDSARRIAEVLIQSIEPFENSDMHKDLANLLRWAFSLSGNTLVDYTDEELYDMGTEPLMWEIDQILYANEIQQEAYDMVESAEWGLTLLESNSEWRDLLLHNIRLLERSLRNVSRLRWSTDVGDNHSDPANPHA